MEYFLERKYQYMCIPSSQYNILVNHFGTSQQLIPLLKNREGIFIPSCILGLLSSTLLFISNTSLEELTFWEENAILTQHFSFQWINYPDPHNSMFLEA